MSGYQTGRPPDDARAVSWVKQAATGSTVELDMDPKAFAVKRFPVGLNHYELALLQMAADLDRCSKQRAARLALRTFLERKVRAAGLALPK
jgi:hypothetical protein